MREKLVFTFPGQGSFDRQLLRNLYASQRALRPLYYAVDEAAGDILGIPFLPMLWSDGAAQGLSDAEEYRDLDQLGIYLANYATARLWLERGTTPDRLIGHSFGELAAFAVAGIYRFEEGARLVCQRVLSLQEAATSGKMAAVAAPAAQVRAALHTFAKASSISVINHAGQTVVSGPEEELSELRDRLAREAVSVTLLKSRYPFHSPLLSAASRAFGIAARGYRVEPPRYPVYVGTEQRLVDDGMDLADALARQLVTPLDFEAAVRACAADGHRRFLECGAGTIVTKIVGRVLKSEAEHREWATFPTADEVDERLRQVGMRSHRASRSSARPSRRHRWLRIFRSLRLDLPLRSPCPNRRPSSRSPSSRWAVCCLAAPINPSSSGGTSRLASAASST